MAELAGELRVERVVEMTARSRAVPRWWARARGMPVTRQYVLLLLIAVFAKQGLQVILFPPFTGHDEVAHYAYIRTVATEGRVPVVPDLTEWRSAWENRTDPPGDYLPLDLYPYREFALDWCCEPTANEGRFATNPPKGMNLVGEIYPNGWQYAANHPPLYYALMTPVYWATDGMSLETRHYALRAASIPFWLAIVWLSYLIVRSVFPRDAFLAVTVPTVVAFQTQLSYEGAMINNDVLSFAIFTLLLYQLTRVVRLGVTLPRSLGIGFVLGLGLLTKGTLLTAVPLVALVIIYRAGWRAFPRWAMNGAAAAGLAGILAAPWYAYLYRTYGNLDGLDRIKALQYTWSYGEDEAPNLWDLFWNWSFLAARWQETWAEFGWRRIDVEGWLLAVIGVVCAVLALAGLVHLAQLYARGVPASESRGARESMRHQRFAVLLMVLTILVAYAAVLQFGTQFRLTQARYYFHALVPLAIVMMVGLRRILPESWRPYGAGGVLVAMVAINLIIYSQYVVPYWYLAS